MLCFQIRHFRGKSHGFKEQIVTEICKNSSILQQLHKMTAFFFIIQRKNDIIFQSFISQWKTKTSAIHTEKWHHFYPTFRRWKLKFIKKCKKQGNAEIARKTLERWCAARKAEQMNELGWEDKNTVQHIVGLLKPCIVSHKDIPPLDPVKYSIYLRFCSLLVQINCGNQYHAFNHR